MPRTFTLLLTFPGAGRSLLSYLCLAVGCLFEKVLGLASLAALRSGPRGGDGRGRAVGRSGPRGGTVGVRGGTVGAPWWDGRCGPVWFCSAALPGLGRAGSASAPSPDRGYSLGSRQGWRAQKIQM